MPQFKYVPLDAILNYVSDLVKADANTEQLKSYALQFYKGSNIEAAYDYEYAIIPIKNYKAFMPDRDLLRIAEVIDVGNYAQEIITNTVDYGNYRLIINQEIFFGSNWYKQARRIAFKGQNREAIVDNGMYCRDCEIGWSIDKYLRCMSIDIKEGEIAVGYYKLIKENDEILIPDHFNLLQALGSYATSRYFMNITHSLTDSFRQAYEMYTLEDQKATQNMAKFKSIVFMRSVDVNKQNEFVFGRNKFLRTFRRNEYSR